MEKIKNRDENEAIYKTEFFVPENRRVKMSFSYPAGEMFGGFYEELVQRIKDFAAREYSEYSGRGIMYRFSANISHFDGVLTSVLCRVSVHERGVGQVAQNVFAQNFAGGKMIPLSLFVPFRAILGKRARDCELFFLSGVLHFVSKNGEICKTDIKISQLQQKNSAYLLKKIT